MSRIPVRIRQTSSGQQWINSRELTDNIFGGSRVPRTEWQLRRYFGATLEPETIEMVVRRAELGWMRDLTDLIKETINFDPHFGCEIGKRFRALASVNGKVVEASGPGTNKDRAAFYADCLRNEIRKIPNFKQQVIRLDWAHCNGRAALEKVWRENTRLDIDPASGAIPFKYSLKELNWIHARRQQFGPTREIRINDDVWGGGNFEPRGMAIEGDEAIPHKFIAFKPQLFDEYQEREGFGPRGLYYAFFKRFTWRQRMVLLEVFGAPWRIIELDKDVQGIKPEDLDDAQDRADELGASRSAALNRGMKLNLVQPDAKGTQHHDTAADCDDEISKLVLGNTRTTSSKTSGQGSKAEEVHQDGETLVINADGWGISDVITSQYFFDWVELNFGPDELVNAPTFELEYKAPPDPMQEVERTTKAVAVGVPIKVDEIYQAIGFSKPQPGDAVVTQTAPAQPAGFGQPGEPAKSAVSTIGAEQQPQGQATQEGGPQDQPIPLAASLARGLRLSRLSNDFFSPRS